MCTPFLRVKPWQYTHVLNVPLSSHLRMDLRVYFTFHLKYGVSYDSNIPVRHKNSNVWPKKQKKNKKTHLVKARQGRTKHDRKSSVANSQKHRGLASEGFWGFTLEPACSKVRSRLDTKENSRCQVAPKLVNRPWFDHLKASVTLHIPTLVSYFKVFNGSI